MSATAWIAVDWGTTNRRAYRIGPAGELQDQMSDDRGTLAIPAGGFPVAVGEIRTSLGECPMLLAGMVGSNRGWHEVPYVQAPAGLDRLVEGALRIADQDAVIIPGVLQHDHDRPDIMRGEEVQLLGAVAAGQLGAHEPSCHPGTHAKWVRLEDGRIAAFRTIMTGELFGMLRNGGILAPQLQAEVTTGDAFRRGARHGLDACDLTAELFTIRARLLTGALAEPDAASYASGLLIGADIRVGLGFLGTTPASLALIGDHSLTSLYRAALEESGIASRCIDGEQAFLAGARALWEKLQ